MTRINPGARAGALLRAEGDENNNKKVYTALSTRLLRLSNSDDYEEANHEGIVTGNVWYIPSQYYNEVLPEIHLDNHNGFCVCGHPIHWHFEIQNTENNTLEIVGSECVENWMIIRHLKEVKGLKDDEITEEKIAEWMKAAVKSMKAEWWWRENGDDFEEMFNAVKEIDARFSVRFSRTRWCSDTQRYEKTYKLAKSSANSLSGFASIVWRWNHPRNPKRQIETRGYPNKKLWREIQLLFARLQRYNNKMVAHDTERSDRVKEIQSERIRMTLAHEERQRVLEEQRKLAIKLREETYTATQQKNFETLCEYYDIPTFANTDATSRWEQDFLHNIKGRMCNDKDLTDKQLNKLMTILKNTAWLNKASTRQLKYIKDLGGSIDGIETKKDASALIKELKMEK